MTRRWLCVLCSLLLLAGGLAGCASTSGGVRSATYLDAFDTVCTVTVYGVSAAEFEQTSQRFHEELLRYHRLYDIYHTYEGLNNLKTVNEAGGQPVVVDRDIVALLRFGEEAYELTDGRVNILFGSVLRLWHDARSASQDGEPVTLPTQTALRQAAAHTRLDCLHIDEQAGTVTLTDAQARLDVGAIAKGFAAQRLAAFVARELRWHSALLDIGGNICAVGGKGDAPFTIGIRNPDTTSAKTYLDTVEMQDEAAVTSGNYQRYFELDGVRYHHIIDPVTLYPATPMQAVTVLCDDSAMADVLSTALFILPLEQGRALLEQVEGARAVWVLADGDVVYSDGF